MNRYILDLADVDEEDNPYSDLLPTKIPCVDGQDYKDLDLDHDNINDELNEQIKNFFRSDDKIYDPVAYEKPIGIDICKLPEGATLRVGSGKEKWSVKGRCGDWVLYHPTKETEFLFEYAEKALKIRDLLNENHKPNEDQPC